MNPSSRMLKKPASGFSASLEFNVPEGTPHRVLQDSPAALLAAFLIILHVLSHSSKETGPFLSHA